MAAMARGKPSPHALSWSVVAAIVLHDGEPARSISEGPIVEPVDTRELTAAKAIHIPSTIVPSPPSREDGLFAIPASQFRLAHLFGDESTIARVAKARADRINARAHEVKCPASLRSETGRQCVEVRSNDDNQNSAESDSPVQASSLCTRRKTRRCRRRAWSPWALVMSERICAIEIEENRMLSPLENVSPVPSSITRKRIG